MNGSAPQNFEFIHNCAPAVCLQNPATVFHHAFDACSPAGYFQMADTTLLIRCIDTALQDTTLERFAHPDG
jgi:hypothetical protein